MDKIGKLKDFLKDTAEDSFIQHALALEYIKLGEDAAAKELFTDILQREPGYIGSYYHLAKLLERTGETEQAVAWYEKGMEISKAAGDQHAYNELRSAHEELLY